MTEQCRRPRVTILSSVHLALDNRVFYRQARTLERAGYEVTLIAVHDRDEVKEGVIIQGLPRVRRWLRPLLWYRIVQLARQTTGDIYQIHDPELLLVTPILRRLTGKPTIYDVHELYPEFVEVKDYLPTWLRRPLARLTAFLEPRLASHESGLLFADDTIANTFADIDCPKVTLFNFPERGFIEQAALRVEQTPIPQPVVLYLGGLERNRGTAEMLSAFSLVQQRLPDARLLLVGHFMPPDLEDEVRHEAGARGLQQNVTITGRVSFEQIGHYLRQAAVGWVPWQPVTKNKYNIPTKLFEYMAYALPVVASDLPSTRPFIQSGQTGYLVEAANVEAHAEAIIRLLNDPELAKRIGAAGQEKVATEYNWDPMADRLLELYERILQPDLDG